MLKDLILKTRSYRRFYQEHEITTAVLRSLVDLARISASARNAQPLKYFLSNTPETNRIIFSKLTWAGFLTDWPGPEEGERPSAYIIVLLDTGIADDCYCDDGIAYQSIRLGATEKGLGGCVVASVSRDELKKELDIPEKFNILNVIALGKPKETVVLEKMENGNYEYWRDENEVHHVPKRSLDDIIINY